MSNSLTSKQLSFQFDETGSEAELSNTVFDLLGGDVVLYEYFYSKEDCIDILNKLIQDINWKQEQIFMYGKKINLPRLTAWYGDLYANYTYSGIKVEINPWNQFMSQIKSKLEDFLGVKFNGVLLNYYRNENDSVAWHQDDEPELLNNPYIASISFGATRVFQLKHKTEKKLKVINIPLIDGSLLIMKGETQNNWLHQVPKSRMPVGERVNLTFRSIKPDFYQT